jgi:hypothetical protein
MEQKGSLSTTRTNESTIGKEKRKRTRRKVMEKRNGRTKLTQ